jgi:hypothetical protein
MLIHNGLFGVSKASTEETGYDNNTRGDPFAATITEFTRIRKVPISEILEAIIDVLSVKAAHPFFLLYYLKNI